MGGEWNTIALEQLLKPGRFITYGIVQPGPPVADGVPIVRVNDVRNGQISTVSPMRVSPRIEAAYSRSRLEGGELLLTLVGTVGETAVVPSSLHGWNTARAVGVIPVRSEIGAYWVQLALKAPAVRHLIDSRLNTTVQATLNLGDVAKLPIVLPPRRERDQIADILGTLDDKIELNRRMNETLEAIARALFKSWFVDFDPVRAKAEGRDTGLPPHIADLFPDSFEDSELGEIPAGWRVGTLGELSGKPQYGFTASAVDEKVGPKFLRITDINKTPWISWTTVPHCEIQREELAKYQTRPGDILIARMADPGHGVMMEDDVNAVFASYLIRFRPRDEAFDRYLQYWLRSESYWQLVGARQSGTTRASINAQVMSMFQLVVPPQNVAVKFRAVVGSLRRKVISNVAESETLSSVRDTLLPKLISGELRMIDAERPPPSLLVDLIGVTDAG